jgi:hypothetical protein
MLKRDSQTFPQMHVFTNQFKLSFTRISSSEVNATVLLYLYRNLLLMSLFEGCGANDVRPYNRDCLN